MRAVKLLVAGAALVAGFSTWLAAVEHPAEVPPSPPARRIEPLVLRGPDADAQRLELLSRAAIHVDAEHDRAAIESASPDEPSACHFVEAPRSGTTPKFDCVLRTGEVVKVKYGLHA